MKERKRKKEERSKREKKKRKWINVMEFELERIGWKEVLVPFCSGSVLVLSFFTHLENGRRKTFPSSSFSHLSHEGEKIRERERKRKKELFLSLDLYTPPF